MKKIDNILKKIDEAPLWILLFPLLVLFFWYYIKLGQNAVFEIHDQLDERVVNNVLNARHLFEGLSDFPEMFESGVPTNGMAFSAITFLFYRWFSPYVAFMLEYAVAEVAAFLGTYFCIKKFGKSSIMATLGGMAMMWMRFRPSYGLSLVGFPIVFYAFSDLFFITFSKETDKKKRIIIKTVTDMLLIVFYGCMSSLVWIGYAVVLIVFFADAALFIITCIKKKPFKYIWFYVGSVVLVITYVLMYHRLFLQFVLRGDFISHRDDWGVGGYPFYQTWNIFLYGDGDYIFSLQRYLIIPILALLVVYGIGLKKLNKIEKRAWIIAASLLVSNVVFALAYGFYGSQFYTSLRATSDGIIRSFQFNRMYWLYPGTWYICAGLLFSVVVSFHTREHENNTKKYQFFGKWPAIVVWLIIFFAVLPFAWQTRQKSDWILNKSQYKNNMSVGLISWKDFYAEDLMREIDEYIGKDKSTYRIASLGIYPCVAQVYGYYVIDGYSDNYPLEYKYRFRKIIEKELEKDPVIKDYYDNWGSRVYVFTAKRPDDYGAKRQNFVYEDLEIDTSLMYEMGCRYIFSAGEIANPERLNLKFLSTFEHSDSFYRIYLYEIEQ